MAFCQGQTVLEAGACEVSFDHQGVIINGAGSHDTVVASWARGARTEGKTHGTEAVPWLHAALCGNSQKILSHRSQPYPSSHFDPLS
jgi:hypothetical protein